MIYKRVVIDWHRRTTERWSHCGFLCFFFVTVTICKLRKKSTMLLKLTLTTKLIVFISITVLASQTVTSSSVKGGSTSSTSSVTSKTSSSSSTATTGKQFQVTTANLAVTSEPSVSSSKNFRDSLRTKSKLVSGGSVPVYSGTIYKQTRPVPDEEALPEVNLDSSAERTDKSLSSGEEFQRILGAETTSVQPIFEDDVTTSTPLVLISKQKSLQQEPVQEVEDAELITANRVSHKHHAGQRIQAAVKTKHTFEFRPVMLDHLQEEIQPKIIEVAAKSVPLEIHFKSASSRIKLVQSHKSGELQQIERTSSNEEPQRLIHISHKPIIQEVREVITPYRRIVQEIQPVMEEIHTIVSHEKEGRTSGKLTHSKTSSTTSSSSVTSKQQHTAQTTQTQKTQQQKVEQQKIPTSWLRPVSNQIQSQPTSTSSNSQQQQGKIEQQKINYSPVFNTYPLEVTSARPLLVNEEADQSEHGSNSEVEDLSDTSIEVVSGNDLNNIIPARVMQEIMHEYQVRVQAKEKAQQQQQQIQQQQVSRPSAPRPSAQQNTKGGQTGFNVQQPQQLRESASSRNWSAVRPYVHYNNVPQQQHQQRNFFAQPQQQHHHQQQQQQQQNFNNYQQPQPQNRFNNFNNGGNRY